MMQPFRAKILVSRMKAAVWVGTVSFPVSPFLLGSSRTRLSIYATDRTTPFLKPF